ncbi:hypothetical protein V6259_07355 [Marinomonas sp. TI.3.20]|uniref:hypothetical protein n=1 Tax=Marinomonas sp. TI.3.20 TaxID=3121296 RepID=UPI00311E53E6
MRILISVFAVFLLIGVSGCTNSASGLNGPSIDVFPVTYRLALQTDKAHIRKSKQEWSDFIQQNKVMLQTQAVTLTWVTRSGAQFEKHAKQDLMILGVSPDNITESKLDSGFNQHFDFQVLVTQHKVVTPICQPFEVEDYNAAKTGCYVESARWQSMVRPERMLDTSEPVAPSAATHNTQE